MAIRKVEDTDYTLLLVDFSDIIEFTTTSAVFIFGNLSQFKPVLSCCFLKVISVIASYDDEEKVNSKTRSILNMAPSHQQMFILLLWDEETHSRDVIPLNHLTLRLQSTHLSLLLWSPEYCFSWWKEKQPGDHLHGTNVMSSRSYGWCSWVFRLIINFLTLATNPPLYRRHQVRHERS